MKKTIFLSLLMLILGACTPEYKPWMRSSYVPAPSMVLEVSKIEVVRAYQEQTQPPFHDKDITPHTVQLTDEWLRRYLLPFGQGGRAVITIEEASIIADQKEMADKNQTNARYVGKISLRMSILDRLDAEIGTVVATAARTDYIPKDFSSYYREQALGVMFEEMFGALEKELRDKITQQVPLALHNAPLGAR